MNNLINRIKNQAWAISPQGMSYILNDQPVMVDDMLKKGVGAEFNVRDALSLFIVQRQEMTVNDGIAYVHVYGPLIDNASPIELAMGCTGYDEIITDIATANREETVKQIILVIDTPGGTVAGIKEAVTAITGSNKPVYGYNAGSATSAGYWIAASTELICASQSAITGNIGAVMAWLDDTEFLKSMGFSMEVITNDGADLKGTFRDSPMTDSQREFLQAEINVIGEEFKDFVTDQRGGLDQEVYRAGWYYPAKSDDLGLIDMSGTLSDFSEVVKERLTLEPNETIIETD